MMMDSRNFTRNYYWLTLAQLAIPLLLLWLTRFAFATYNSDILGKPVFADMLRLSAGGLRFDLSAWAYFNALFFIMRFLPGPWLTARWFLLTGNIIFCITNSVMLTLSLADIPFFRFSGSRLRLPALTDMFSDPNMGGIILSYAASYLWVFICVAVIIFILVMICRRLRPCGSPFGKANRHHRYLMEGGVFLAGGFLLFCAMRGSLGAGRPLAIADAVWYTDTPPQTNIVLNTPFCLLRSADGGMRLPEMQSMSQAAAEKIRSSVHHPAFPPDSFTRKNVVVITLESGSQHFIDRLCDVPGHEPRHLMPFLDSLASVSLVNRHLMATGKRSIEGITAIYGGFPTFGEMIYMSSPYNANTIDSHARLLRDKGYATRFYFGGNHGSYSIDALARAMGYDDVADRSTFNDDSQFDGHWGIYDHAMAEYAARDLSTLRQPFAAGWFTLQLHEPFATPGYWRPDGYLNREKGVARSAEYTDRAIRHFFEIARTQPWYPNTLFIITGDHGCRDLKDTPYDTPYIQPHVMFIAYTPDGSVAPREITDRYMSQFDIGPTLLGLLRYPDSYVAVGADMSDSDTPHYAIGFFNSQFTVTGPRYMVTLTDGATAIDKVFDIVADPLASRPLAKWDRAVTDSMLRWTQAFLTDYTFRMNHDALHH